MCEGVRGGGVLGPCFVVLCVLSGFAIILLKKRELVCFTLIMEWLSCSLSIPHGALVGLHAVCDCGISWSCSITYLIKVIVSISLCND